MRYTVQVFNESRAFCHASNKADAQRTYNKRDAQILNARRRAVSGYYCNLQTQVHVGCEHGNSLLSTEQPKPKKQRKAPQYKGWDRVYANPDYDADHDVSMNY